MLLLTVSFSFAAGQDPAERPRFTSAIRAFVSADSVSPPPKGAIEFIGSSIFRQWTTVADDMKPLPVFNRAFGGSRTLDLLDHMDVVVLPYEPKIIVYYCGSNDINGNLSVDTIVSRVEQFVSRVHARLPQTKIFVVSVNKAPQKRNKWGTVDSVNYGLMAMAATDPRLGYIDVNRALFAADGQVKGDLFRPDSLHLTPPAYVEFTAVIRPIIEKAWNSISRQ
jgi:hypothetical protein